MKVYLLDRDGKIVAKEIFHYEQLLLLPQLFKKSSASGATKSVCKWESVKMLTQQITLENHSWKIYLLSRRL